MNKKLGIFSLFILMISPAFAQGNAVAQVGKVTAQVEREVAKQALKKPYVAQAIKPLNQKYALWLERSHSTQLKKSTERSKEFTKRPIDEVRHSIVPSAVTVIGSEKSEVLNSQSAMSPLRWKQTRLQYYTPEERERLRKLLTTDLGTLRKNKPAAYSLEDYIYDQVKNNTGAYLIPVYKSVLRDESEVYTKVAPYISGAAFSPYEHRLDARQIGEINGPLFGLIRSTRKLLQFMPNDPYLQAVNSFYTETYKIFNPLVASLVDNVKVERPDGKKFDFNEFLLFTPEGKDYVLYDETPWTEETADEVGSLHYLADKAVTESAELLKLLPSDLHIAVLNDDIQPLANFKQWAKEGHLGANAVVETFEDGKDLLAAMRNGTHFDLIITDILVPNGGRSMMPALRTLDPQVTVFGMSKFTRQNVRPINLFDCGMDGYLPYTPVLNDPEVGYLEFLRAYTNYTRTQALKWSHNSIK